MGTLILDVNIVWRLRVSLGTIGMGYHPLIVIEFIMICSLTSPSKENLITIVRLYRKNVVPTALYERGENLKHLIMTHYNIYIILYHLFICKTVHNGETFFLQIVNLLQRNVQWQEILTIKQDMNSGRHVNFIDVIRINILYFWHLSLVCKHLFCLKVSLFLTTEQIALYTHVYLYWFSFVSTCRSPMCTLCFALFLVMSGGSRMWRGWFWCDRWLCLR